MGTCKDCQFWGESDSLGLQVGNLDNLHNTHRQCMCDKLGECGEVEKGSDTLVYQYNEGGGIDTGPDFGCVHFQPTEAAADKSAFERAGVKL